MKRIALKTMRSASAWAFLAYVMRGSGGLILLPLMARLMPSEELGLWFVFVSMTGLLRMLDSGLATALVRAAAYLWAGAPELRRFGVGTAQAADAPPNLDTLAHLVVAARLHYRFFALSGLLLGVFAGTPWIAYLSRNMDNGNEMKGAWLLFLAAQTLIIWGDLWPSLLTGINRVREAQQIQVAGAALNLLISAVGLLLGARVWALVMGMLVMGVVTRYVAAYRFRLRVAGASPPPCEPRDIRRLLGCLYPTAWRTSVRATGSYLMMPAMVFVSSSMVGLHETASFGMALQLLSKLANISSVWLQVKLPVLSSLWAHSARREIQRLFVQRMRLVMLTLGLGTAVVLGLGTPLLRMIGAGTTLPPLPILALLCLACVLQVHMAEHSALIIASNHSPFWLSVLLTGAGVFGGGIVLASRFGLTGLALPMLLLPLTYVNWAIVRYSLRLLEMRMRVYLPALLTGRPGRA